MQYPETQQLLPPPPQHQQQIARPVEVVEDARQRHCQHTRQHHHHRQHLHPRHRCQLPLWRSLHQLHHHHYNTPFHPTSRNIRIRHTEREREQEVASKRIESEKVEGVRRPYWAMTRHRHHTLLPHPHLPHRLRLHHQVRCLQQSVVEALDRSYLYLSICCFVSFFLSTSSCVSISTCTHIRVCMRNQ